MTERFTIMVGGKPIGKKAPTFTGKGVRMRSGRLIHAVPNTAAKSYQKSIAWAAKAMMVHHKIAQFDGPVRLLITVVVAKAKSNKMSHPMIKPDWDNVSKIVGDGLNKVAYKDDVQVVEAHVYKRFGEPKLIVTVECVGADDAAGEPGDLRQH